MAIFNSYVSLPEGTPFKPPLEATRSIDTP
jgi:hypothetical protein